MVFGASEISIVIRARDEFSKTFNSAKLSMANFRKSALGAAAVGTAIAVGMGKAVSVANDIETGFAKVNTLLEEGQDAQKEFSKFVSETNVAMGNQGDQVDVLNGLYQTISAGITDTAEAQEFMTHATKAATGGSAELSSVILAGTKTIAAFGLDVSDTERIMDAFAGTVKAGQTTMGELSAAFPTVAGMAGQAGMTIEETLGTFAGLTKVLGSSEETATSLSATIRGFIKPSEDMKNAVKRLGFESSVAMIKEKGLNESLRLLQDSLGEQLPEIKRVQERFLELSKKMDNPKAAIKLLSEEIGKTPKETQKMIDSTTDATEAMAKLFPNVRALKAVFPLLGLAAEDVAASIDIVSDSTGLAQKQYEDMTQTAQFKWGVAMSEVENLQNELGISIKETLLPLLQILIGWIKKLSDWWNNLSPGMKQAIVILGLVTVAVTLLAGAIALITLVSSPWILIILAVIAVVTAIILVILNWKKIMEKLKEVIGKVGDFITDKFNKVKEVVVSVIDFIKEAFSLLVDFLMKASGLDFIFGVISDISGAIKGSKRIKEVGDAIIRPNGQIIKTHPKDTLIATRGGVGGVVVNIESVYGVDPTDIAEALQRELSNKISLG